jgi:acetyltransferase-like isoleucine patch superfamily enzyme
MGAIAKSLGMWHRLWRGLRSRFDEHFISLHRGLRIGQGTAYSRANLDGIVPQLAVIGRNCVIAPNAVILTHDASYLPTMGRYRIAPVEIGDRVFVGYGAVIMPGIRVGSDSVIAAGAVVTKDVPNNSVAAGVPARIIGNWPPSQVPESELIEPTFGSGKVPTRRQILEFQKAILRAVSEGRLRKETSSCESGSI